jgi:hypothetical protein
MVVGVVRIDIRLFDVHSLKQKRSQVSRLLNRLRSKFPLSIAEVGMQDLHQRALLGGCVCSGSESLIQSVFRQIESDIESSGLVEIVHMDFEYLHYGEDLR